jgi:aspartyl-tRNA(Asn)/glutamyl-tRNA(Gln) amidotransferase subunit C
MAVSIKDVEYVAKLARLKFNDQEKEKFTHELNDILKYVEKLSEVDTEGVDISISSYPMYNALREDEVMPSLDRKTVLENAPDSGYGYFKVPKVIE